MQSDLNSDQSGQAGVNQPCENWQPLLTLFAAGAELDRADQDRLSYHISECAACSESLAREKQLIALLATNRTEPDAALLASCRAGLSDALDREEERGWLGRTFGALLPLNWASPRPAWSAALLLLIGFSVGILGPRLLRRTSTSTPKPAEGAPSQSAANDSGSPAAPAGFSDPNSLASSVPSPLDLRTADVAGINVLSSGGDELPQVELQLKSLQPVTVRGTVNDDNVKQALLSILRSGERVCPDVRLDAVDLLRACSKDPAVRTALCDAVHTDRNAAVRLKALEALGGEEPHDLVRNTLLDALVDDDNPGVRVEAIDELRDLAAKGRLASDDHLLSVLRERMQKDPNTYIRLQSAAAIRDLGPREKF